MSQNARRGFEADPFEDDYRGFDPRDDESARGPLILALALGVLLVFAAVVWNTYRQGVRAGAGDVPLITADSTPYKRAPDGGAAPMADDLSKRIYDQFDGSERLEPQSASVLQGGPPIDLRPGLEGDSGDETGSAGPAPDATQVEALADLDTAPAPVPEREMKLAAATPAQSSTITATRKENPQPTRQSLFAFDERGAFLVQIAALRSEASAEALWSDVTKAAPDTFYGAKKSIQRADLGAKGVFYRLRAGRFSTRDDAGSFCDALKADGRQCIVVAG